MTTNSNGTTEDSLHKCETERQELLRLNMDGKVSWPKIARMAKYRGIPVGSLWSFAHGERDLADEHKAKLGIPFNVPVAFCVECNEAHTWNCHTQKVKPKHKPEPPQWVKDGADFLAKKEKETKSNGNVYARGGKLVKYG